MRSVYVFPSPIVFLVKVVLGVVSLTLQSDHTGRLSFDEFQEVWNLLHSLKVCRRFSLRNNVSRLFYTYNYWLLQSKLILVVVLFAYLFIV